MLVVFLMILGLPLGLVLLFLRALARRNSSVEFGHLQACSLMGGLAVVGVAVLALAVVGILALAGSFR
jgi:hypothetical protein